jgi:phage terminase Nu1 subunit (DNA packaging protein)
MAAIRKMHDLPSKRLANRSEMAEFLGVTLSNLDDWGRKGLPALQRPGDGRTNWVFDIYAVVEWKVKTDAGLFSGEVNVDGLLPGDRDKHWSAKLKEQTFLKNSGELLDRCETAEKIATFCATLAQNIRSMADMLERRAGMDAKQAKIFEESLEEYIGSFKDSIESIASVKKKK